VVSAWVPVAAAPLLASLWDGFWRSEGETHAEHDLVARVVRIDRGTVGDLEFQIGNGEITVSQRHLGPWAEINGDARHSLMGEVTIVIIDRAARNRRDAVRIDEAKTEIGADIGLDPTVAKIITLVKNS